MSTLQQQARALGDPTRHAIFQFVAGAPAPVGVAEITAHMGCSHNAVRQHLAKLAAAGLIEEGKVQGGRGRPRLSYRVAPDVDGRWAGVGPYELLSVLLTEMIRTGDSAVEVGRRSTTGPTTDDEPLALVTEVMERQGFGPQVHRDGDDVDMVLTSCPFASAAVADPDTICSLHLGIAQGVVERTGGRIAVDELVPHDPRRAGCRLRLHQTC